MNDMQDALGHWVPHPNANVQWSAHLVDDLFQLGQAIESSRADFVVDGQLKHYSMLVPVTSEVNNLGLNPVVTTTDQIRRAEVRVKPKASTDGIDHDFTLPFEFSNPNPNTVDTGMESPSAQDERLEALKN